VPLTRVPAPPQRIGPYELHEELGRGAMGVVFRARHVTLGREVALKRIAGAGATDPKRLARFLREARAAATLAGTPGVVTVHDVGEEAGAVWFAMDLVPGRSLAAHVEAGPIAPRQAATWLAAIARAVGQAHARGILHRDLKPANILIDAGGAPHVTDFGLARVSPLDAQATRLTRSDEVVGTPAYMPPEQARAEPLEVTADVYALGATAYEMLTGEPPFEGDSVLATLLQVLQAEPDPARLHRAGVPRDLVNVVLRCLEKDPALR
jgi:serine/threonine-protein kinase